jgi:RimJ/RimL family protein N-acetyltransferase
MYSAFVHPSFPKYLPLGQIGSVADVMNWIRRCIDGRNERTVFSFSIDSVDELRKIGQVSLFKDPSQSNSWAIAYWIHPTQWGQGYATEAAERALEYAFEELDAALVWAGASDVNPASMRTIEKLGLHLASTIRHAYSIDNVPIAVNRYEIDRQSWSQRRVAAAARGAAAG